MEQQVLAWIAQYGYLAIFSLLVLGIVGLPVPDETLLTFTGYLVFQGHLALPLAFLSGWAGSACGASVYASPTGSRRSTQDSRSGWSRCSFPVGLLHPLQHAGLSRRTA